MKLTREEFAAMRRGAEHDLQMSAQMPSVLICAGTGCIAGNPVDTIAGATISSNAVISAYNSAIDCYNNEIKGVA